MTIYIFLLPIFVDKLKKKKIGALHNMTVYSTPITCLACVNARIFSDKYSNKQRENQLIFAWTLDPTKQTEFCFIFRSFAQVI